MDVQGKTIVITGAAQGLGQKMAEVMAHQGARLAIADLDHAKLKETLELCSRAGAKVKDYALDVADEAAVEALFNSVDADFGGIDGVINNAGVTSDGLLVKAADGKVQKKMSLDDFHKVVAIDLRGVFLCGREAAVHMVDGLCGGVIINISSISRAGNVGQTNYSAAKAGVAAIPGPRSSHATIFASLASPPDFARPAWSPRYLPRFESRSLPRFLSGALPSRTRLPARRYSSCRTITATAGLSRSMAACI